MTFDLRSLARQKKGRGDKPGEKPVNISKSGLKSLRVEGEVRECCRILIQEERKMCEKSRRENSLTLDVERKGERGGDSFHCSEFLPLFSEHFTLLFELLSIFVRPTICGPLVSYFDLPLSCLQ